jgi:CrcB protein
MEYWMLFERGQNAQAAAYVLASVIGAIAACGLGLFLVRQVSA